MVNKSLYEVFGIDGLINPPESWQSPILYRVNNEGRVNVWMIGFDGEEMFTAWGTLDAFNEGRLQTASKEVKLNTSGRNLPQQVLLEANNLWLTKQELDGYSLDQADKSFLDKEAMLASQYKENCLKKGDFPVYAQAKLDGLRCRAHLIPEAEKVELVSRASEKILFKEVLKEQLKEFIQYLQEQVKIQYEGKVPLVRLDGELYSREINFDEISGVIRRKIDKSEQDSLIDYYIFDIDFPFDLDFHTRYKFLKDCYYSYPYPERMTKLILVPSQLVNNHDEILSWHQYYEKEGFEGLIVRRGFGEKAYYKYGRSTAMYKLKSFEDAEFEIVGGTSGKGKDSNCIIWILTTSGGKTFNCRPALTHEERKELFFQFQSNPSQFLGKQYKVKYQEINEKSGVPKFPIGLGFVEDR